MEKKVKFSFEIFCYCYGLNGMAHLLALWKKLTIGISNCICLSMLKISYSVDILWTSPVRPCKCSVKDRWITGDCLVALLISCQFR